MVFVSLDKVLWPSRVDEHTFHQCCFDFVQRSLRSAGLLRTHDHKLSLPHTETLPPLATAQHGPKTNSSLQHSDGTPQHGLDSKWRVAQASQYDRKFLVPSSSTGKIAIHSKVLRGAPRTQQTSTRQTKNHLRRPGRKLMNSCSYHDRTTSL
ncbi:hypothetical protein KCU62_g321, partial [Aureobasidium sp. EXF-3399]